MQTREGTGILEGRYTMNRKKKVGGTEIAFRPQTIIEARYDLDRRQNDIIDILLGIVGEGNDTEENTRYEINISDVKHLYNLQDESNAYSYLQKAVKKFEKKIAKKSKHYVISEPKILVPLEFRHVFFTLLSNYLNNIVVLSREEIGCNYTIEVIDNL